MNIDHIMMAVRFLLVGVLAIGIVVLVREDHRLWFIGRYDQWGLPEKLEPKKTLNEDFEVN